MTYPFEDCPTQPLIDVRNITLKNIESQGGLLSPGIIRCNASNPCNDINLHNIKMDGWWRDMNWTFITEYVDGDVTNVNIDPQYGKKDQRKFELLSVDHAFDLVAETLQYYQINQTDILGTTTLFGIVIWALG